MPPKNSSIAGETAERKIVPGPRNASIGADNFRYYQWTCLKHDPNSGPGSDVCGECGRVEANMNVLSVTSIRKLNGIPFNLANWMVSNVIHASMGTMQQVRIGPRGGVKKVNVVEQSPSDFVVMMHDAYARATAAGHDSITAEDIARIRAWLRDKSDRPRDQAAVRGSTVHKAIELGVTAAEATPAWVEQAFANERYVSAVVDDDVNFVKNCLIQHANMRSDVPYVILGREVQCWNLTHGYAGTFDCLLWMLPSWTPFEAVERWQTFADAGQVDLREVTRVGGTLVLGDYKTSGDTYTDNVIQLTAYLTAEFVGHDGIRDERMTDLLTAALEGCIIHIRPNGWALHYFPFREDVLRAFLGSCALARFLAAFPKPQPLFSSSVTGGQPLGGDEA